MPKDPREKVIKTKEEVLAEVAVLADTTAVDPVQQAILDTLLDIRDSMDSLPGNRRRMMQRGRGAPLP